MTRPAGVGVLGAKVGMTQVFRRTAGGADEVVPVTVLACGPCPVIQARSSGRDGYAAVQVGYDPMPEKRATRPLLGHFRKAGTGPFRHLREFRLPADPGEDLKVGAVLGVDRFQEGQFVDVIGTSRGKGFAGAVKRHGFAGGPKSHGQSDRWRAPGSVGSTTFPGRTLKGLRMAGRMGGERVTVHGLEVVKVDRERGLLAVRGAVPGPRGGLVMVRPTVKKIRPKGASPPPAPKQAKAKTAGKAAKK